MTETKLSQPALGSLEKAMSFILPDKNAVVAYAFDDAGMRCAAEELIRLGVTNRQPMLLEVTSLSGSQVFAKRIGFNARQIDNLKAAGFEVPANAIRVGSLTEVRQEFNKVNVFDSSSVPNYTGNVPGLRAQHD